MITHEKHYTIRQLKRIWQINYHTLRRWFIDRQERRHDIPDAGNGHRWHPRIPESVATDEYQFRNFIAAGAVLSVRLLRMVHGRELRFFGLKLLNLRSVLSGPETHFRNSKPSSGVE